MARLPDLPEVAALTVRPAVILIFCDRIAPEIAAFRARFLQTTVCLVTEMPGLAADPPADVAVECGRIDDPHWLRALVDFHGPDLIIDQREPDPGRGSRFSDPEPVFAVGYPSLARGGVYALRAKPGLGFRIRHWRRGTGVSRNGYWLAVKPGATPAPIRLRAAADIPSPPAVTIAAQPYRRAAAELVNAREWIVNSVRDATEREVVPLEARVFRYRNATVFGYGLVQVGDAIVDESLINRDRSLPLGALRLESDGTGEVRHTLPHPRRIAGETVHLWQIWAENYGHWLIECLPRLHVVARAGLLGKAKVTVQAIPGMEGVYRESLAVLGFGEDRIVWLNQREVIFETLIYPTPITRQPIQKSPLVIDAARDLRDRIGPPADALPERIYVSRNRSGRRRLLNEDAVIALLETRGYRVVHPETERFARQVQIFAAARFVVGGMGAALSNLAFAEPGVCCLMLTNQDMLDDFFLDLVALLEGTYVSIHGASAAPELGMHADYTIDVEILRDTLDRHGF